MKPILFDRLLRLAALAAALSAGPARAAEPGRIIVASQAGAHLDSSVTTGGGTDDTAVIQGILDRAPQLGSLTLIVDGAILTSGLRIHANTTIQCLNRACGFYLADNANRPIFANATPRLEGRTDRNISFLGGTYNGNAAHQEHTTPERGWTTAFALHGVEQLLFRDVSITNARTFSVYLTNWRRAVFENVYLNLDHIPTRSNQDGIHVQGPGEFLSIRNLQGRAWDDLVALNIDDLLGDWTSDGRFVRDPAVAKRFGAYSSIGAVTDVDIDGVQAEDCAQVIRILSRASRLDRVSIRNVRGTYRDFGVWITPYFREGGNIGRVELENIDLRPAGPRAYSYVPPFLVWLAGGMEQVILRNLVGNDPIDGRPLVWIQPDARIGLLRIEGLDVRDPRPEPDRTPLIRADGRIGLLQVRDVVVQRPAATRPAGSLVGTSPDRAALKAFMDARVGLLKLTPGSGWRGWPEGYGYLQSSPEIGQLSISHVVADQLEHVVDLQVGHVGTLALDHISGLPPGRQLRRSAEASVTALRLDPAPAEAP